MYPLIAKRKRPYVDAVIVCISGFKSGTNNGMSNLSDTLRSRLNSSFTINPNNIFQISWNENNDSDLTSVPLISAIQSKIYRRSQNPKYLAIIGHSFGGWAACRLSRVTTKVPNYIALIDPVFGPTNTLRRPVDVPRGTRITEWFQNNGIEGIRNCPPILRVPCSSSRDGIACGYQGVPRASQRRVINLRTWTGIVRRIKCNGNKVPLRAYHTNIDDDQWIHRQIYNLKRITETSTAKRKKSITTSNNILQI
ncbi:hypothetical protein GC093_14535 [Paenibacillus sp. LMG 31456]|uniref:Uncharacterized protein n=1 Tax=Paenibacillus foliorum TaxID=2654974 RepID=A0A972H1D0_9BACL|nr:hypothetical protein [Paenibacillus foliorum]NOU94426.1 hypothetical protein [Paenibacillus foliorum]